MAVAPSYGETIINYIQIIYSKSNRVAHVLFINASIQLLHALYSTGIVILKYAMLEWQKNYMLSYAKHLGQYSGVARGGTGAMPPPPKLLVNVFFLQLIYVITLF